MGSLDPRVSLRLRAEFLRCATSELTFEHSAIRRQEILSWLDENGWLDEMGLRLREPREQMPWIEQDVAHGSWLHRRWTAIFAMYPQSLSDAINSLRRSDRDGVEPCLQFLESDPWCDFSGYMKQTIVRFMRHVSLGGTHLSRLHEALLIPVFAGPRTEFREYVRTARAFATPEFRIRLGQLSGHRQEPPRTGTEQRARWMLEAIERT